MAKSLTLTAEDIENFTSVRALEGHRAYWKLPPPERIRRHKNAVGFEPTTVQARQVESLAALGMTSKEIGQALLIPETLVKFYYKRELAVSVAITNAKVGAVALKMALSGNEPDMTKFWLKTRAGWKETRVVEQNVDITDSTVSARSRLLGETAGQTLDNETSQPVEDIAYDYFPNE